jgi:hypothetical protein
MISSAERSSALIVVALIVVIITLIIVIIELRLNLIVAAGVVALAYRYDHRIRGQRAQINVRDFRIESPLPAGSSGSRQHVDFRVQRRVLGLTAGRIASSHRHLLQFEMRLMFLVTVLLAQRTNFCAIATGERRDNDLNNVGRTAACSRAECNR